jgi:hypothetical protein
MSASAITMHDFVEALRLHVPPIHPCGHKVVHSYFAQMRDAVDNPAEVARLAGMIRARVVQDRWQAESAESAGPFKDAWRLRRQADGFEAAHV